MAGVTATEIVSVYLSEVGEPRYTKDDDGLIYLAPYPTKNPDLRGECYLHEDSLTRIVWKCLHKAPSRRAVRDALVVLQALAEPANDNGWSGFTERSKR